MQGMNETEFCFGKGIATIQRDRKLVGESNLSAKGITIFYLRHPVLYKVKKL